MHGTVKIVGSFLKENNKRYPCSKDGFLFFTLTQKNLSVLDKYELTEVDISAKHKNITKESGAYIFFIESSTCKDILYVGSSKNLYSRLISHWGYKYIAKKLHPDLKITLKYIVTPKYSTAEWVLITNLSPIMNVNHNWTYKKLDDNWHKAL